MKKQFKSIEELREAMRDMDFGSMGDGQFNEFWEEAEGLFERDAARKMLELAGQEAMEKRNRKPGSVFVYLSPDKTPTLGDVLEEIGVSIISPIWAAWETMTAPHLTMEDENVMKIVSETIFTSLTRWDQIRDSIGGDKLA